MTGTIGFFDSGVGGLSVWREVAAQLPAYDLLYLADQAYCPYGPRSLTDIRQRVERVARFLMASGAQILVVACNTASAAALAHLRRVLDIPVVGMEPALKPAVEQTTTGKVAVMATVATFQGEPFTRLMGRFAHGVDVRLQPCPGLVEQIEAGDLSGPATVRLLQRCLGGLAQAGVDELVLGCTHYPFVRETIAQIVGPTVQIIDPAAAVARQVARVAAQHLPLPDTQRLTGFTNAAARANRYRFYTTGTAAGFANQLANLTGMESAVTAVDLDTWVPALYPAISQTRLGINLG